MRWPRGVRGRLIAGTALIMLLALGVAFVATYSGTGTQLRHASEQDLRADAATLSAALQGDEPRAAAKAAVTAQPFRGTSRLIFIKLPSGGVETNEPEILGRGPESDDSESPTEQAREDAAASRLLALGPGFHHAALPDTGRLRVLVRPVRVAGGTATVGIGESEEPVTRAQREVARAFAVGGGLALLAAIIAIAILAGALTRPLRRMAAIAARVSGGDLSHRMTARATDATEIVLLAEAFDRMLDRLDDAFDRQRRFIADASHELRTPLTILRGQLEVLAAQPNPDAEEVRRVERLVSAEIDRMARLVEDLLVLARAEEEAFVQPQDLELASLLEELLHAQSATADRRFLLDPVADVNLLADPDRVAQAVRNLLSNAVAHTGEGGIVRLGSRVVDGFVEISVADDGPGIPPGERARVFDRFHRIDASRVRREGGAGLGLAIVRAVAEAHGGRASAGVAPEGGALVAFTLPVRKLSSSETSQGEIRRSADSSGQ